MSKPDLSVRDRLLKEGAAIFIEKGFGGASVREICARAETSSNMIHHYFGSKQGLYDEIIAGFSDSLLEVPMRIISEPPTSVEDLATRFRLFFSESVEALIARAAAYELVSRDRQAIAAFNDYYATVTAFLGAAQERGFLRAEADHEMLTGLMLDRIGNQIFFAPQMQSLGGANIMEDADYRSRWVNANVDLVLFGLITR